MVDFPANWWHGPYATLLPYPTQSVDIAASLKPLSLPVTNGNIRLSEISRNVFQFFSATSFDIQVWITIILAATSTIGTFYLLSYISKRSTLLWARVDSEDRHNMRRFIDFVLGNLLAQGSLRIYRKFSFYEI